MKNKKQFYIRHMLFSSLLPSFISAIALAFADIADAVVVGNKIGESGLAAIGIVCPVYMIYNILGYGLSVGGEVVNSRLAAAGKNDEANKHFNMVLWTGIFWGAVLAAVGLVFYRQFLFVLGADGQDKDLFRLCSQYVPAGDGDAHSVFRAIWLYQECCGLHDVWHLGTGTRICQWAVYESYQYWQQAAAH